MEGAGVRLKRVFGFQEVKGLDPFLLLDDFGSDDPDDYIAGFPWHPHRGIETVTYMLSGEVEHGDSLGNKGTIKSGDMQWMTAGSGIIHQEMPKRFKGTMRGFQLWVNLPARSKMMDPRYRDVTRDRIVEVSPSGGVKLRIIAGEVDGVRGPVQDVVANPEYLDITLEPGAAFERETPAGHTVFAYVIGGQGSFGDNSRKFFADGQLALFSDGDRISARASPEGIRFLLVSGKPLNEPVAWRGPIVMNTDEELQAAFEEYANGTFIKHTKPGTKRV
jgi:redox-sensitive bicupin YhaK (pirin superfamily)